ncbi:hypothetical protein [Paraburkholderia sp. DHOC27]|uniref:hypothetical protein n=1 Tax=Paraburkholderia sp. DHOC27 TaxID=2303330 RepID=UPI000E3B7273|nr:hypothetical protein [Paraburkholderia sp. DHOC27]RFU46424.1 hypothetical protein D0B32_18670 [Paraburkholderia sp. DHOC27]
MQFDYRSFHINCAPRATDDGFVARASITRDPGEGERRGDAHQSGDLGTFPAKDTAIAYARSWAVQWCDENWA